DPEIAIVGCKLLYPNDTIQHAGCHLFKDFLVSLNVFYHRGRFEPADRYSLVEEMPAVTFAAVLARRSLVGKLDESYEMGYYEDMDKCCEVRKNGYKVIYNGQVSLYHYESATLYKIPSQYWKKHQLNNCILFRSRWLEWLKDDVEKNPELYGWTKHDVERFLK
ncbi:MAG: glycosyltransferase family 2 protein, partial [Candidatus Thorarchaeota archaeon]